MLGISGIGMSALAALLAQKNVSITGSDLQLGPTSVFLEKLGIPIQYGNQAQLPAQTEVVIHSLAVAENHPILQEARGKNIPLLTYPQAVGELTREYYTIAVCGTHGKSTITSLISKVLIENNFDPSVIVGTTLKELNGTNVRVGTSKFLVLEACEYKRAFLNYTPQMIVLQSLDPDHLDYYKNFDDYLSAFREFTRRLPDNGYFFGNSDDEDVGEIIKSLRKKGHKNVCSYGAKGDFYLKGNIIIDKNGEGVAELNLKIPGAHNRSNALAAFSICHALGIAPENIVRSLNNYEGAYRRFQKKGRRGKTEIIDDYGHHPAEIKATLQAAREAYPKAKICCVFQPHQYNRTKNLLKEFGAAFSDADLVIVPNIYEVRDSKEDVEGVSTELLVKEIEKNHTKAKDGGGLEKTAQWLKKNAEKFDLILTMGAGDVYKVADAILTEQYL